MNNSNLNILTYDYYPWKYPRNWPRNIRQFFRNIKWAWQRATRGFADRDTWNMDYFYAELFADSLKRLAETSYGYPSAFMEFNTKATPDAGSKEWKRLLLEASENFKNYNLDESEEESRLYDEFDKLRNKEFIETENLDGTLSVKCGENSPEAEKARKAWLNAHKNFYEFRTKCKDNGFDFLKKWFEGLWD